MPSVKLKSDRFHKIFLNLTCYMFSRFPVICGNNFVGRVFALPWQNALYGLSHMCGDDPEE